MQTDLERDQTIEELRTALREQAEQIAVLQDRVSNRTMAHTAGERLERRSRSLSRGGMLKAAAMGAIGLAGAEAVSVLGADTAHATTDVGNAPSYEATGKGPSEGFIAPGAGNFHTGGRFYGDWEGVQAQGVGTGVGLSE